MSQFSSTFSVTFSDFCLCSFACNLPSTKLDAEWVTQKQHTCPHDVWCTAVKRGKVGTFCDGAGKRVRERFPGGGNSWIKIEKLGKNYPREERMRGGHSRKKLGGSKGGEKECWLRGQYVLQGSFNFTFFFLEGNEDPFKQKNEMIRCIFLERVEIRQYETGAVRRPIYKENNMCA